MPMQHRPVAPIRPAVTAVYLGDGVIVELRGDGVILTTSDGQHETNRIVLEPAVLSALLRFVEQTYSVEVRRVPRATRQGVEGAADTEDTTP
jgi:hypothetical protein